MRISAVKQVSSDVVEITTEDGPVFFIRSFFLRSIKQEDIVPGAEFLDEKEEEIVEAGLSFAAERKAEEYLARCEQCRAGLEKKLASKNHSKQSVKAALDYLEERKLLDDIRFSCAWLRSHIILKPQGRKRLLAELCRRGIKTADAKAALDIFFEGTDEDELFLRAYSKAVKNGKSGEKLKKCLMDSGFPYKMICMMEKQNKDRL